MSSPYSSDTDSLDSPFMEHEIECNTFQWREKLICEGLPLIHDGGDDHKLWARIYEATLKTKEIVQNLNFPFSYITDIKSIQNPTCFSLYLPGYEDFHLLWMKSKEQEEKINRLRQKIFDITNSSCINYPLSMLKKKEEKLNFLKGIENFLILYRHKDNNLFIIVTETYPGGRMNLQRYPIDESSLWGIVFYIKLHTML